VRPPSFPNATRIDVPVAEAAPGDSVTLDVSLDLAADLKLNEEGSMAYLVETPGKSGLLSDRVRPEGERIKPARSFTIKVPLARPAVEGDTIPLRVSVLSLVCREVGSVCFIKSTVWNVPVRFSAAKKPGEAVALSGSVSIGKG
jgi:hypothetical protein